MTGSTKKAGPGWYPDPKLAGTQRYWDGERWTSHVAPLPPAAGKPVGVLTVARGVALGIGIVLAALSVIYGLSSSNDDLECAQESAERVLDGLPPLDCD